MELGKNIAAVVTGGASGLGEATARRLRSHGVQVTIFDFDAEGGKRVADELDCHFCQVDVTDEDNIAEALATARSLNGQERVLVNCAGVSVPGKSAKIERDTGKPVFVSKKDLMANVSVNLMGTFMCAAQSAAGMMTLDPLDEDGERGAIVNVASTEGESGKASFAAYSASKGGVLGMTLPMARDFHRSGIRVNAILPGFFMTGPKMVGSGPKAESYHEMLISETLFPKRAGRPAEFARLVEHLLENSYINAINIRIDAGQRLG